MKITEDVRRYAAEQGMAEEEAVKRGLKEKRQSLPKLAKFIRKCDAHFHEHGFERERPGR